jgi:hypothetical protein
MEYTLYTRDCVTSHSSNSIIKFADDTTVVGLITNNDEMAYREEVGPRTAWQVNNLSLNVSKTNELIVDFRRNQAGHAPILINGATIETVPLVHISKELKWSNHTDTMVKKELQ